MAELKTKPNDASVEAFIEQVEHPVRKENAKQLLALFNRVTGVEPQMWGDAIIGYGRYTSTYASGRDVEWMRTGFSPRKQNLSLYVMPGFNDYQDLIPQLGKVKTSKACLYINKLADVDMEVLEKLVARTWQIMQERYPD